MFGTVLYPERYSVSRINRNIEVGFEYLGLWSYRLFVSGKFGGEDTTYSLIWDTLQNIICREDGSEPDKKTINNFLNYAGEYMELVRKDSDEIKNEVWDFLRALDRLFKS